MPKGDRRRSRQLRGDAPLFVEDVHRLLHPQQLGSGALAPGEAFDASCFLASFKTSTLDVRFP